MYAIMLFLVTSVVVGTRSANSAKPLPRGAFIVLSVLLALALTSRRVI